MHHGDTTLLIAPTCEIMGFVWSAGHVGRHDRPKNFAGEHCDPRVMAPEKKVAVCPAAGSPFLAN